MITALTHCTALLGDGLVSGAAILIEDGKIKKIARDGAIPKDCAVRDLGGQYLLPGFIDVQVNGGAGVLFNDDPSVEAIARIGAAHRRFGTTGFLPTFISDDLDNIKAAIEAVEQAIAAGVPGVLGIHVEGPFISAARKGVHDSSYFRALDEDAFKLLTSLRGGRTLVTLAPEMTTPQMIKRLAESRIIISAGHTNASYDDIRRALAHGVTGFTHLFNAMSPLGSREPGTVGGALDDPGSWCGIIVDGIHVHPATLKIAIAAKGLTRFMLVTDAMPSVGMSQKSFSIQGRRIAVRDGACFDSDGVLAGSDLDMAGAVRNATSLLGLDLVSAVTMASRQPAQFLGLDDVTGRIAPGLRADLVLADKDLAVLETWIAGQNSS